MTKRAYDNAKREQQGLQRRATIVETMISMMALGEEDVSVADVAKSSGVSLRTVYQYFPDKDARIRAINDWIDERVDVAEVLPRGFEDIPSYVERLVDYMLRNETLMRVQMAPGLAKQVRNLRKKTHARHLRRALRERIPCKRTVEEVTAFLLSTVRVEAVFDLRDLYGLSESRIMSRMRAMVELVLTEASREELSTTP